MKWLNKLALLVRRGRFHQEMDEEISFHMEALERELQEQGMSREEARRQARIRFGGEDSVGERTHAEAAFPLESFWHDLRYGARVLAKSKVFTVVVVASLAIGIGANVAIFSVMNAVLLQNLPVRAPEELVFLNLTVKKDAFPEKYMHDYEGSMNFDEKRGVQVGSSMPLAVYREISRESKSFDQTVAFASNDMDMNIGLGSRAVSGKEQAVSGNFFAGLGVTPVAGRMLQASDDDKAATPVVVVSYKFFQTQMGGEPGAVGSKITINNVPATVVGVAPPDFFGFDPSVSPDFWLPISTYREQWERVAGADEKLDSDFVWWLTVIGRLKPGVSMVQAQAESAVLFARTIHAPENVSGDGTVPQLLLTEAGRGLNSVRRKHSTSLWLLMGMSGLVLLIACTNVASLLLARATSRQREVATRISLGAGRGRVIRQLMTEALLLAVMGGVAGILLARLGTQLLIALLDLGLAVHPDARALGFATFVCIVCSFAFGLPPALRATNLNLAPALQKGTTQSSMSMRKFRAGKALVVAQVALSVVLLFAAGLLVRTLGILQHLNLGFDSGNLVSFAVRPSMNGYQDAKLQSYHEEMLRRLGSIPEVSSATLAQFGPIGNSSSSGMAYIPGFNTPEKRSQYFRHVIGPNYFETLSIPLLMGRTIEARDTKSSRHVMVINETMMRRYFGGQNPLGREVMMGSRKDPRAFEIVGVARDVKYVRIRDEVPPTAYIPVTQFPASLDSVTFLMRIRGNAQSVQRQVENLALDLDRGVPVVDFRTEEAVITHHLRIERMFASLSSMFAVIGLLLASVGLYGTIAYSVVQRTNEIGVRIALGAARENILRMILADTMRVVMAGLCFGLPAAWAVTRLLQAQLYGLSNHDLVTAVVTLIATVAATVVAGLIPAAKASGIDPMVALRYE